MIYTDLCFLYTCACLCNYLFNTKQGSDISFDTCSHFGIIVSSATTYQRTQLYCDNSTLEEFYCLHFGGKLFNFYIYE